mmetsp:Transcript_27034/g.51151  ORF Transcript_27034/g.51151 Transcript_27034/m.51151 type:complete len:579 (-) Transcript_27034:264-2000(-)
MVGARGQDAPSVAAQRAARFKAGLGGEAQGASRRAKRAAHLVTLRKEKMATTLAKRRRQDDEQDAEDDQNKARQGTAAASTTSAPSPVSARLNEHNCVGMANNTSIKGALTESAVKGVLGDDAAQWLMCTRHLRKQLSRRKDPPIDEALAHPGLVQRLTQFLQLLAQPEIQLEAAWALTNLTSGTTEQTRPVLEAGAAPLLVQLVASPSSNAALKEQCAWALGNIAGDSAESRAHLEALHAVQALASQVTSDMSPGLARTLAWALANFCRRRQPLEPSHAALPALHQLLYAADEAVCTDTCWGLNYYTEGSVEACLQLVHNLEIPGVGKGVSTRMLQLLADCEDNNWFKGSMPALRTLGNLAAGENPLYTQDLLEAGALDVFNKILSNPARKGMKKEACWLVSNVAAGEPHQVQALINADVLPTIVWLISTAEFEIRREACWVLTNCTMQATVDQVKYMVKLGCLEPICNLLDSKDTRVVQLALEAIRNILHAGVPEGQERSEHAEAVEELGGLDQIEQLQSHADTLVYEKAVEIIECFYGCDEEDENIVPSVHSTESKYVFTEVAAPPTGYNFMNGN